MGLKCFARFSDIMSCSVAYFHCGEDDHGQRLDNFIIARRKKVPKSRIYRAIRSGEVRVNRARAKQTTRLSQGDIVRVPPMHVADAPLARVLPSVDVPVLHEDEDFLVVNKPSGYSVHSGSGVDFGVIDLLQQSHSRQYYLVHRLDKDVSGCLLLAKRRQSLLAIQRVWSSVLVEKVYHVVVFYDDVPSFSIIETDLVTESGRYQCAKTSFSILHRSDACLLLEVTLHTGRKHQIRRHLASVGLPVVNDRRYGDFAKNRKYVQKRYSSGCMLHARRLISSVNSKEFTAVADYPSGMNEFINNYFSEV